MTGASTAPSTIAPSSAPAIKVTGSRARRWPTRPQYESAPRGSGAAESTAGVAVLTSAAHDPRVDQTLQDVDGQVQQHEGGREHEDDALQQRHVALEDRDVQQVSGAGPREHRFDEDGA